MTEPEGLPTFHRKEPKECFLHHLGKGRWRAAKSTKGGKKPNKRLNDADGSFLSNLAEKQSTFLVQEGKKRVLASNICFEG